MKRLLSLIAICIVSSVITGCDEGSSNTEESKQIISLSLRVPSTNWSLDIQEIWQVENELWVIATLGTVGDAGGAAISIVTDSVEIIAEDLPIKYFILGKTWNWENQEPYTFINNKNEIEQSLNNGRLIFAKT